MSRTKQIKKRAEKKNSGPEKNSDINVELTEEELLNSNESPLNPAEEDESEENKGSIPGEEQIEVLESKLSELNDKLLRSLAEMENLRRRAQREREDATKYGIKNFAGMVIKVADNLERGLKSIDPELRKKDPSLGNIAVGFEMVHRELLNGLEQFGVRPMEALGKRFDPLIHEAMFEVENKDLPAGSIMQVLEGGYFLHDRTLRAAKVGITKGGPKDGPKDSKGEINSSSEVDGFSPSEKSIYEEKKLEPGAQVDEEL